MLVVAFITVQLNPRYARQAAEAKLLLKNVKLTPADPHAGKNLRYRLNRGELSVDVEYTVSASQLKGLNIIVLNQVTLGDKVSSPDATKMSVKLAPERDSAALRRLKLESGLRRDYWRSLRASVPEKTTTAEIGLTPEKRADLLAHVYPDFVKTNGIGYL